MIERDGSANLPALAARQLFDDTERSPTHCSTIPQTSMPCGRILERLMERILQADDIATTTWLLTELERRPSFDATTKEQLLDKARQHCTASWLQGKLERGTTDELLQLSSLVMQLGDDTAESFAAAAAAVAHPLSQWLSELLGHPGIPSQPPNRPRQ